MKKFLQFVGALILIGLVMTVVAFAADFREIEDCSSIELEPLRQDSLQPLQEAEYDAESIVEAVAMEAPMLFMGENGVIYECVETLEIIATAYCHCEKCCGKTPDDLAYGITKSGLNLLEKGADIRIVAADTKVLPLGTKIFIEVPEESRDSIYVTDDYGIATVEDTGGGIKGNRIDVYFKTHQEALEWGVRNVQVHVIVPVS